MDYGNSIGDDSLKKIIKQPIFIAVFTLVLVCVAALAFFISMGAQLLRGESYETRSISEYGVYEGHIEFEGALFDQFSQLLVFPDEMPDSAQVNDFYYACSDVGLDNSYQLLLDYRLPDDEFQAEVKRLQNISVSHNGKTKHVVYDAENFKYPAYVTLFRTDGYCEFAMVDEQNNRIIAVLAGGGRTSLDKGLFPQNPVDYETDIGQLGFSIYHFPAGNGAAVMAGQE